MAFVKVMCELGWEASYLPCGDLPLGDLRSQWDFVYAWPLCEWEKVQDGCILWLSNSWSVKDHNRSNLERLSLLRNLRGKGKPSRFAVVSLDNSTEFKSLVNSLGFDMLPYKIIKIIENISTNQIKAHQSSWNTPHNDLYKASIAQLAHQIKNGWFLGGESLGNNYDLSKKIFESMKRDFFNLEETNGEALCEESLIYIDNWLNNNLDEAIETRNLSDLLDKWLKFYTECNNVI